MERGVGKMGCLAGVGGHISNMILSAKSSDEVIVLDGCSMACASKVLEHAGITPTYRLVATDIGLVKKNGKRWSEAEVKVLDEDLTRLRSPRSGFVHIE
jgi:uncharacterized metal-binding protein